MKTMYDIIKKQNGEHFAKAIRAYDNGIFDIPDLDKLVKHAGRKAEPLMNYLVSLKDVKIEEHAVHQHPFDLLSRAGYTAYYADTLEKQNWPKQFYAPGEELCTFRDPERYKKYHIVVAIKKNVKDIKRENFPNPQREDEYGTSVLQIQMLKSGGFISIKNRYNHTVPNPDNTFNSNPDNIIPGLSDALKHYYHVDFSSQKVQLPENYVFIDNQIVKYNYEINNVYFGENFYAKNGEIHDIDKQKELMLDYFILNLQDKSIKNPNGEKDGFMTALQEEIKDKKLQITVNEQGNKCLQADGKNILELDHGKIKSLHFDNVKKIDDNFLWNNKELSEISLSQVKNIGNGFLENNNGLTKVILPEVSEIGYSFLYSNASISDISMPQVSKIGFGFLFYNKKLNKISLPKVRTIEGGFLYYNKSLEEINLPQVIEIANGFLYENEKLSEISLPQIKHIGNDFLLNNEVLVKAELPKVISIGNGFLKDNRKLTEISLPQVTEVGRCFLFSNEKISKVSLPQVTRIGEGFLYYNGELSECLLPKVKYIENSFLFYNENLAKISLPEATHIGDNYLYKNKALTKISLPKVNKIGDWFLGENEDLKQLSLPCTTKIGDNFLYGNKKLSQISLPQAMEIGDGFLYENEWLQRISLPEIKKVGDSFLENHPNGDKLWENKDKPFTKDNNNFKIMQDIKSNHRE